MTRGYEAQQEIKKRAKKARAYFDDLGWKYGEPDNNVIEYVRDIKKGERITFLIYGEDRGVEYKLFNTWVDERLHQVIQMQLKEIKELNR